MKTVFLFDVDGTIVNSGQKITSEMAILLNNLKKKKNVEIGIVGGGKLDKILEQMDNKIFFNHYFTECGCVYHDNYAINNSLDLIPIYTKNIRDHKLYTPINLLIKYCLQYLSKVDYTITGHFIDLRHGIIYVSLIGLTANETERVTFMELDKKYDYRKNLIESLIHLATDLGIQNQVAIVEGGSVGIAIYPSEYDKIQILNYFPDRNYNKIYYFGDKYKPNGNDYKILNHVRVEGFPVNHYQDTMETLQKFL